MFGWFKKSPTTQQLSATPNFAPGRGWTIDVAGESNYQIAIEQSYRRHGGKGHDLKVTAELAPDLDNPHDANAVMVTIDGNLVGFLPRDRAHDYRAAGVDQGACSAKIVGGHRLANGQNAHFGVKLNLSWPPKYAPN